jgi:tRNA (guanine37-N1)-methyltransferase
MRFDVLTLFPEMFSAYIGQSILKRAVRAGTVSVHLHDIRDWATGKHLSVDDRPFGGGPGMVMKVEPVVEAVEAVRGMASPPGRLIMLTPQGRCLNQAFVEELAREERLILLAGRYEGFDERIRLILNPTELSIGDYVLSGGELPAMVVMDSVMRLVPGVLGDEESSKDDSFSGDQRLLEFSQYTRPREYRGWQVPEVLMSGDHGRIAAWRAEERVQRTLQKRGDCSSPDAYSIGNPPACADDADYHKPPGN